MTLFKGAVTSKKKTEKKFKGNDVKRYNIKIKSIKKSHLLKQNSFSHWMLCFNDLLLYSVQLYIDAVLTTKGMSSQINTFLDNCSRTAFVLEI